MVRGAQMKRFGTAYNRRVSGSLTSFNHRPFMITSLNNVTNFESNYLCLKDLKKRHTSLSSTTNNIENHEKC